MRQRESIPPPQGVATWVAPRGIGAPHEPEQHLCHRVPSVAGSGFVTVADINCPPRRIGATYTHTKFVDNRVKKEYP